MDLETPPLRPASPSGQSGIVSQNNLSKERPMSSSKLSKVVDIMQCELPGPQMATTLSCRYPGTMVLTSY